MPSLAATLRSEVRRLTSREVQKALRPLRRAQKQLEKLRKESRAQRRLLAALERRAARAPRGGAGGRRAAAAGAVMSGSAIFALRSRLKMSRKAFAAKLGVSPGSIFGWEKGRTMPRGSSLSRIQDLQKGGAATAPSAPVGRPRKKRRVRRMRRGAGAMTRGRRASA